MLGTDRYPEELKYSSEHEWVRVDGDRATVGISWFAQDQLGDVVFVELPSVGDTLKQGEAFGVVESVKTLSDLYAPVSGEVVEINEALEDRPEQVNEEPYGSGWMLVIRMADPAELDDLLDAAGYRAQVEG